MAVIETCTAKLASTGCSYPAVSLFSWVEVISTMLSEISYGAFQATAINPTKLVHSHMLLLFVRLYVHLPSK